MSILVKVIEKRYRLENFSKLVHFRVSTEQRPDRQTNVGQGLSQHTVCCANNASANVCQWDTVYTCSLWKAAWVKVCHTWTGNNYKYLFINRMKSFWDWHRNFVSFFNLWWQLNILFTYNSHQHINCSSTLFFIKGQFFQDALFSNVSLLQLEGATV